MNDIEVYKEQLLTFNNPVFISLILFVVVLVLLFVVYIKIIFPMQKKMVLSNQRFLLERAELMALFAELDPDPLLRIDNKGTILQSNEAARQLFCFKTTDKLKIYDLIPNYFDNLDQLQENWAQEIKGQYFNIIIRKENKLGFINIYLHDITTLKKYESQLELKESNLSALSTLLDKQSEELKTSISSQIHDDIGQRLALLKLKVAHFNNYGEKNILADLNYVGDKVRDISHQLVPIRISTMGLIYTIKKIVDDMSSASEIEGYFESFQEDVEYDKRLPENVKILLLNCVQEGINNVIKHSHAKMFMVSLFLEEDTILLEVGDNGIGISSDIDTHILTNESGIGLLRLRERVRGYGGEFKIMTNEIYSTILNIKLPIGRVENGQD